MMRSVAAAMVLLSMVALQAEAAAATNWTAVMCDPLSASTKQPCPNANQCCAIWGICGTGTHFCEKGHCAGGACVDGPVIPASAGGSSTPSPPSPPQTSCGAVMDDTDLWGADVNNGTSGASLDDCCAACAALPTCGAYTFDPQQGVCYLKSASGWDKRSTPGLQSAALLPASSSDASQAQPTQSTCGAVLQDVDLSGGDLAGAVNATSAEDCCSYCRAQQLCGAFTYLPSAGLCYLKADSGWTRQAQPGSGMQSVITGATATNPYAPPPPNATTPSKPGAYVFVPMTNDQLRRMYQLTSVFENADITLQYAYADRLYDGRGVTYGFCGFTTGTGDGLMVVDKYTELKPGNPLAKYLPALRKLAGKGDKFTGLDGFEAAVHKLGKDEDFIQAQWDVCDTEYHEPAMQICKKLQCAYALTKAQLHDALVNHGQGLGDKFSVDYILANAKKAVGGTPATGVDEVKWLKAFLKARYDVLYNWDKVARASVKRITMYQKLVDLGDLNLDGPIYIDLKQHKSKDGQPVWQIKDVYYGTFLIYENPSDDQKLALIP